MDTPNDLTLPSERVCTNAFCTRRGDPLNEDGVCSTCLCGPTVDLDAPSRPSQDADPARAPDASPAVERGARLRGALRVHVSTLRVRIKAEPLSRERIPRDLRDDAILPVMRAVRVRDGWEATWREPEAPLQPFHGRLAELRTARARIDCIGKMLSFFAQAEACGAPALDLFDDAVWVDPDRDDDLVVLAGAPSGGRWASAAARYVFAAWTAASDMLCDAASSEDALRWNHMLCAVEPAMPPEAVALLRDAICDDRDAAALARAWAELSTGEEGVALAADLPFRYGAAQRAGRRKGPDTLLPSEYQQDRHYCAHVRVGGADAALLALADGVSTADYGSGAVAAARAVASLEAAPRDVGDDAAGYLRDLVRRAHEAVCGYGRSVRGDAPDEAHGPASTLTLALVERGGGVTVAWVGDTPAYGWDPQRRALVPLTFEHQGQFDAVARGVDARSAREHEDGHRLVQCLGAEACEPAVRAWRLRPDGGVVLATDGLLEGFARDRGPGRLARAERFMAERFAALCGDARHLQWACEDLCDASDAADGHDNLTVVALVAGELPSPAPAPREERHRGNSNGGGSGSMGHARR